jgi:hypothetical protein
MSPEKPTRVLPPFQAKHFRINIFIYHFFLTITFYYATIAISRYNPQPLSPNSTFHDLHSSMKTPRHYISVKMEREKTWTLNL